MNRVLEIEQALRQLPSQERWEIARWLLEDLQEGARAMPKAKGPATTAKGPGLCLIIPPAAAEFLGARSCRTWSWLLARKNPGENLRGHQLPVFTLHNRRKFDQGRCVASGQSRALALHRLELRTALSLALFQQRLTLAEVQARMAGSGKRLRR